MLSDLPIESCEEEEKYGLDRYKFSESLGKAIIRYKEKESFVMGLSGEWGSGKTSIINMTLKYIQKNSKKLHNNEKPIIIRFNPWNFSNQNQLLSQFFRELIIKLGKTNYENIQNIAKKLEIYANFFEPIGLAFPPIGLAVRAVKKYATSVKSLATYKLNDLEGIRKDLDNSLSKQKHKIIIVIDDIDRLNGLEIRQIFQLVKLLANFPNTIYILEFDKKVVSKSLENDVSDDYSLQYLEKIVQVIFEVPKISEIEIDLILKQEIEELIGDYVKKVNIRTWNTYYYEGLRSLFKNIRDVKRYINTLELGFELLKDDVIIEDLLAITAIQVFLPDVYKTIKTNKRLLAFRLEDILSSSYDINQNKEYYKEFFDKIIRKNSDKIPEKELKSLLKALFPILGHIYGENHNPLHDTMLSICVPDAFDTYFRLSVPKWTISRQEFNNLISNTNDGGVFSKNLVKFNQNGKIVKILEYLEKYTRGRLSWIPPENIEVIITVLMDKGDLFPPNDSNPLEQHTASLIYKIFENLIQNIKENKKFDIIKNAILKSENSIIIPAYLIGSIEELLPINKSQLNELKKILCAKIQKWAKDGRLIKHYDPFGILYYWNEWCGREKLEEFLNSFISDPEVFISFIKKTNRINYHKKTIDEVIGLIKLKNWIIELKKSSEFKGLDNADKQIINAFFKYIS